METTLIILVSFCTLLAAQGYYFGFKKPPPVLAYLQQTTFVVMTFILIPFLLIVLWLQWGAKDRLAETGILPHPSITEALGIAVGVGANPIWLFEVEASASAVADFYRATTNRPGWNLTTDTHILLILRRGSEKMVVGISEKQGSSTLSFQLTTDH
jgi:hypothetical protein